MLRATISLSLLFVLSLFLPFTAGTQNACYCNGGTAQYWIFLNHWENKCPSILETVKQQCWPQGIMNYYCNAQDQGQGTYFTFNLQWKDNNCVQNALWLASPTWDRAWGVTCGC